MNEFQLEPICTNKALKHQFFIFHKDNFIAIKLNKIKLQREKIVDKRATTEDKMKETKDWTYALQHANLGK